MSFFTDFSVQIVLTIPIFTNPSAVLFQCDKFASLEDGSDDNIRPWFEGIVETEPQALEGAGKIDFKR